MKAMSYFKIAIFCVSSFLFIKCVESDTDNRVRDEQIFVELGVPEAPGYAQYKTAVETGYAVRVPVDVVSNSGIESLRVIKKINLEVDPSYGDNGVAEIVSNVDENKYEYMFEYTPTEEDVDQLVGFTFESKNKNGHISQTDLTLVVTFSPKDNLPRRRWVLSSVLWVNNTESPNSEEINDCEKDNSMLLNEDGSMSIDYGKDTGAGACGFDGLTGYDSWSLSDDEMYFTQVTYNVFTPDQKTEEVYTVRNLTTEEFAIELSVDMSAFGLTTDERFLYTYKATVR